MKPLSQAVVHAVENVFANAALSYFAPVADKRGDIVRRYYQNCESSECEVCVYRDKWWTKSGGVVRIDLYCLVDEVQQALGGCRQSWLHPDYEQPLKHFQYGLSQSAKDLSQEVRSEQAAKQFGVFLSEFLFGEGLAWFQQFRSRQGIKNYFLGEEHFYALARYCAHTNDREGARVALQRYLESFPRQNERELEGLVSLGLLREQDRRLLASAALQQEAEYQRRVREWLVARANTDAD